MSASLLVLPRAIRWLLLALLLTRPLLAQQEPELTPGQRMSIVDSLSSMLQNRYVDSAIGAQLGSMLQKMYRAGEYAEESNPSKFARRLQQDMATVVKDLHLRVTYEPTVDYGQRRRNDGRDSATIARTNYGFVTAERLPGNVGYLKLDRFVPLDYSRPTALQALGFLASTEAMIIDLRDNIGGSPDLVSLILSHFYGADSVLLFSTRNRGLNLTNELRTTTPAGRRMADADLYVLTSATSASAAESFAYAVRQTKRGTIIGSTTAGAGNGGAMTPLGAGLVLFLPQWKVVEGPGWETIGVPPDSVVAPSEALAFAHELALKRLMAKAPTDDRRRTVTRALETLHASRNPAIAMQRLTGYSGTFGERTFWTEGTDLYMRTAEWKVKLIPISIGVFRAGSDSDLHFNRRGGKVVSVTVTPLSGGAATTVMASR